MKFSPKVLVSANISADLDKEMNKIMKDLGVTEEKFLTDAIRFYRDQCVHTLKSGKKSSRRIA